MASFPDVDVPLVGDMSSDYLSRPIPWERFDVVYGGAQKNLGPAGLAVMVVRTSVLEEMNPDLPSYLRLGAHADKNSLMNTPPMFAIYVTGKVLRWMRDLGGVAAMEERAARRSGAVYEAIDGSDGFYRSPVEPAHRSHMNIVFRTPSDELDAAFLAGAEKEGLVNLKGHRSVGGIRASIYNAMTDEGVEALVGSMSAFRNASG
jgi:phosphoserine aminotransferase